MIGLKKRDVKKMLKYGAKLSGVPVSGTQGQKYRLRLTKL